jgi:hypothetical protein
MKRIRELIYKTSVWDRGKERVPEQNYIADLALRRLSDKTNP